MAFRRMRRAPGRRRRAKVLWDRAFTVIPLLSFATPTSQVIGDPTILPGSAIGFDQNRTLRRVRLSCTVGFTNDLPQQAIHGSFICGVYCAQSDSIVRNPGIANSDDAETDWIDLWQQDLMEDVAAVGSQSLYSRVVERDIRVNRKLTNDEVVVFTIIPATTFGAIALAQGNVLLHQSLLWTADPT